MGRKFEVTGKAVIYTSKGVEVVDAEVRRIFNAHLDSCNFKFKRDNNYLLIGGARTIPTTDIRAQNAFNPARVQRAVNYGETKFFRLMLDLMRLAQWQPLHKFNLPLESQAFRDYNFQSDIDFDKHGTELDRLLFAKYNFTPAMIQFTEARYR